MRSRAPPGFGPDAEPPPPSPRSRARRAHLALHGAFPGSGPSGTSRAARPPPTARASPSRLGRRGCETPARTGGASARPPAPSPPLPLEAQNQSGAVASERGPHEGSALPEEAPRATHTHPAPREPQAGAAQPAAAPRPPAGPPGALYGRFGALNSTGVASDNAMGLHRVPAARGGAQAGPPHEPNSESCPAVLLPRRWPARSARPVPARPTHHFLLMSPRVTGRSGGFPWLPARCRSERRREPPGRKPEQLWGCRC